ncbi:HTH-like domain-containing protein [Saccharospirillum impatiens]|uniref:HTH-like domain-containing protein n=1 Tax=Saccharospirillum impatiens TaxID=169438 RepID=UPI00048E4EEE|nr:hypothetical protein [Saccharospirillum impatiens]
MKPETLGEILSDMYVTAKDGEKVSNIHLFGIRFAKEITSCGTSPTEIARHAGIDVSYGTEISKGRKLAKYVLIK